MRILLTLYLSEKGEVYKKGKSIKVLHSKLLVLADYLINELKDQYKYPSNYFNNIKK